MNDLNGKVLVALGDSLTYGAHLKREQTWVNLLGEKYGMDYRNCGVSGSTISTSDVTTSRPMWMRLRDDLTVEVLPHVDYFVLQGGANDCWHNVPLGEKTDNLADFGDSIPADGEVPTFCGAINYIINTVKTRWPGVRLLLLTNYNRKVRVSATGHTDEEYVDRMVEMARFRGVPVVDNYHEVGIDLRDPARAGTVTDYAWAATSDSHISPEGYKWLLPIYEKKLLEI